MKRKKKKKSDKIWYILGSINILLLPIFIYLYPTLKQINDQKNLDIILAIQTLEAVQNQKEHLQNIEKQMPAHDMTKSMKQCIQVLKEVAKNDDPNKMNQQESFVFGNWENVDKAYQTGYSEKIMCRDMVDYLIHHNKNQFGSYFISHIENKIKIDGVEKQISHVAYIFKLKVDNKNFPKGYQFWSIDYNVPEIYRILESKPEDSLFSFIERTRGFRQATVLNRETFTNK